MRLIKVTTEEHGEALVAAHDLAAVRERAARNGLTVLTIQEQGLIPTELQPQSPERS